jgi:N12 class adenine-specific DNA methylase
MAGQGHNNPPVILELTREEAEFVLKNAEDNMAVGLNIVMAVQAGTMSREVGEKTVALIEAFRPIRDKTRAALK